MSEATTQKQAAIAEQAASARPSTPASDVDSASVSDSDAAGEQERAQPIIRRLSQKVVNRIAAGEVLERPAAGVKELVENSLDAHASKIRVSLRHGGKSLLRVQDNGCGMNKKNLLLAIERHATSKLPKDDLLDVHTFGFRGEALAAITAVSRTLIKSCQKTDDPVELFVEAGKVSKPKSSVQSPGTDIQVQDLFFATPARLRFLRSDAYETSLVLAQIERIALANPYVQFECFDDTRRKLFLPASQQSLPFNAFKERIAQVMGNLFLDNAFPVTAQQRMRLQAFCSFPSHHINRTTKQFLFVNRRPVQDRVLASAIRIAYGDSVPARRFPLFVAFLDLPRREVDVNVHPSKTEVRFRDLQTVRTFLMASVKTALEKNARHKKNIAATLGEISATQPLSPASASAPPPSRLPNLSHESIAHESIERSVPYPSSPSAPFSSSSNFPPKDVHTPKSAQNFEAPLSESFSESFAPPPPVPSPPHAQEAPLQTGLQDGDGLQETEDSLTHERLPDLPLGVAKACLHKNYIVTQTLSGLAIVDAHAAHERLLFETLKRDYAERRIPVQKLLIPEIVSLPPSDIELLRTQTTTIKKEIQSFGFLFEPFDDNNISLREIPSILRSSRAAETLADLCALLREDERDAKSLLSQAIVDQILSRIACHAAVRSQKTLNAEEMNALLRKIEHEPKAAQCNHGRPTTVTFSLKDLEKLFERR